MRHPELEEKVLWWLSGVVVTISLCVCWSCWRDSGLGWAGLRGAALAASAASSVLQLTNIYDAKTEQLQIGPYFWGPFPHVDFWLEQDDAQILQVPE